jgi:hypothetical protein
MLSELWTEAAGSTRRLDRKAAKAILGHCRTFDGFMLWYEEKIKDLGLGNVRNVAGYFLRTAEADSEWIAERLAEEEAKRERAEYLERKKKREWETPVSLGDAAYYLAQHGKRCPPTVLTHFERQGIQEISPAALRDRVKAWQACVDCRDTGITGRVIDGSIHFCACEVGRVFQAAEPEYTNRVLADPREFLAMAADEAGLIYVADAVRHGSVTRGEDGSFQVIYPREYWLCFEHLEGLESAGIIVHAEAESAAA